MYIVSILDVGIGKKLYIHHFPLDAAGCIGVGRAIGTGDILMSGTRSTSDTTPNACCRVAFSVGGGGNCLGGADMGFLTKVGRFLTLHFFVPDFFFVQRNFGGRRSSSALHLASHIRVARFRSLPAGHTSKKE
jgi:hypothetical protein